MAVLPPALMVFLKKEDPGSGSEEEDGFAMQCYASGLKMPLFQLLADIVLYKTGPNQCPALKNNSFLVDIKSYAQEY